MTKPLFQTTWNDLLYFSEHEFQCKCAFCRESDRPPMNLVFVGALDELRARFGRPMIITSGFRCAEHPIEARKAVPGAHHHGLAADVAVYGESAFDLLTLALEMGVFSGIGVNQHGPIEGRFLHFDMHTQANRPWLWSYA